MLPLRLRKQRTWASAPHLQDKPAEHQYTGKYIRNISEIYHNKILCSSAAAFSSKVYLQRKICLERSCCFVLLKMKKLILCCWSHSDGSLLVHSGACEELRYLKLQRCSVATCKCRKLPNEHNFIIRRCLLLVPGVKTQRDSVNVEGTFGDPLTFHLAPPSGQHVA